MMTEDWRDVLGEGLARENPLPPAWAHLELTIDLRMDLAATLLAEKRPSCSRVRIGRAGPMLPAAVITSAGERIEITSRHTDATV